MMRLSVRGTVFRALLPLALGGLVCHAEAGETSARSWTLAAHICVAGDLSGPGAEYSERLMSAAAAGGWTLHLQLSGEGSEVVRRSVTDRSVTGAGPAIPADATAADRIESLLRWSRDSAPAQRYGLIIYGHDVRSTAGQSGGPAFGEIDEGIRRGLGRSVDLLVLDRCYGGSVEAAWELRDSVDLLVGAPGRRGVVGVDWSRVIGKRAPSNGIEPVEIAAECVSGDDASDGSGMIALRPSGAVGITEALGRLVGAAEAESARMVPLLTGAASRAFAWGGDEQMVDLLGLCREFAAVTEGELRCAALATIAAVEDSLAVPIEGADVGPSIGFPTGAVHGEQEIAGGDGFAQVSGWSRLTEKYRGRLHELINRPSDEMRDEAA